MSDPYISEIRLFAGNFAPVNFAFCNGQIMSIAQNTALFSLLGTNYGGNGQTTFALPDLRGRLPVGQGTGAGLTPRTIGELAGEETHTLILPEMPVHNHAVYATTATGNLPGPTTNSIPATPAGAPGYLYAAPGSTPFTPQPFSPLALPPAGGSQPHTNLMPAECLSFIICLYGVFPSRN
ncbi:phage tail protein [Sphingomonas immobilis]|uniref:Tail fiber protein n=1 Tax=Sphingomonas immobilis TaxID=3063997 RepID=A0ABT8ZZZ3_9SPHN|nr:tail fiber protein [Sphingomonas sp. CA1-15]MDO7843143.1 tail fiber protein [Sphingomonas sp. CA1-15]